jgi:hypothetical protein
MVPGILMAVPKEITPGETIWPLPEKVDPLPLIGTREMLELLMAKAPTGV